MLYKVAQAVGLNTDQEAAQVGSSVFSADNLFLPVLKLSCDDAFTQGRQLLSEFSDIYMEKEGAVAQKLSLTFKEAEEKLSKMGEFDLCLAVVSGKVLYIIYKGAVSAYIQRSGKLTSLQSVGSENQLISGFLQPGDRVFLSTNSLVEFLGDDLSKTLLLSRADWEDELSIKFGESSLEPRCLSGLILDVEDEEVKTQGLATSSIKPTDSSEAVNPQVPKFAPLILGLLGRFKRPPQNEYYLTERGSSWGRLLPKGKWRLGLAAVLILVLLVGVGLKVKQRQDQERILKFNRLLESVQSDWSSAQSLQMLNPPEARQKLESAKQNLAQALATLPGNPRASELKNTIDSQSGAILGQFTSAEFPLFLDLNLVKEGFSPERLSLSSGKLLLLDSNDQTLITVDLFSKSHKILAGEKQLGQAKYASLNGSFAFVYSSSKGAIRVDTLNQKETEVDKKVEGDIADIVGFASNIYLLDKNSQDSGQIWKYIPITEGYSVKGRYLNTDAKADFGDALRMQIESSIYVMKRGGEMLRFTRGAPDFFSYSGLDTPIKDPRSFYVSSETENLYLLDSGNSRLLVLNKTGAYQSSYQGEKFATASDLVVDEKGKKAYLLEGSKIYTMDLR